MSYSAGPRTTPCVDGDCVYFLGAEGDLLCLDASRGDVRWSKHPVGFAFADADVGVCFASDCRWRSRHLPERRIRSRSWPGRCDGFQQAYRRRRLVRHFGQGAWLCPADDCESGRVQATDRVGTQRDSFPGPGDRQGLLVAAIWAGEIGVMLMYAAILSRCPVGRRAVCRHAI